NRSIERFHGSPIFDEKMFGTIHVAFGRNDQLGGKIKGFSHHDLTVLRPSVFFDCHPASPVIENRRFILSEREIELDWSELKPHLERHWRISPSGLHCSYEPKTNGLVMEWMQCAGPKASTRVGNLETSILAGSAYHYLTSPGSMTVGTLVDNLEGDGIPRNVALAAIEVLRSYKIANISRI